MSLFDFALKLKTAQNLDNPSLSDVAIVAKALLNTLGGAWDEALRAELEATRYRYGDQLVKNAHPLFWTTQDCVNILHRHFPRYLATPETLATLTVITQWELPNKITLLLVKTSDTQLRLYYRCEDAMFLIAHGYKSEFGSTPFSCAISDEANNFVKRRFSSHLVSRHWFSTTSSHSKSFDAVQKRLTAIAKGLVQLISLSEAHVDALMIQS